MKNILLSLIIILAASAVWAGELTRDNANETVTDSTNSLMWQDDSVVASATYTWVEAIDYCENLDFAGYTDWRLPNLNELGSIVDHDRYYYGIYITFRNTYVSYQSPFPHYWSSTTVFSDTSKAWVIYFNTGSTKNSIAKTDNQYARCVREL